MLERSLAGRTGRALTVSALISEDYLKGEMARVARAVMIAREPEPVLTQTDEPG